MRRSVYHAGVVDRMEKNVTEDASEGLLRALQEAHRQLDAEIEAMRVDASADQLALARLKKRKLRLRDEIARVQDVLVPDIIA